MATDDERRPRKRRPRADRSNGLNELVRDLTVLRSSDVRSVEPRQTFRDRVRTDQWQNPFRGVYTPPHVGTVGEVAARAALASVGEPVWLARASVLWILELIDDPPADVQLIVPNDRRLGAQTGLRLVRSRNLEDDEVATTRGLPITTVARALRDLCATWSVEQLLPIAIDAVQQRKLRIDDLREQRRRVGRGCRGVDRLDTLIAELELDGSDSIMERHARVPLVERLPVRPYPRPMPWRAPDGVIDHLDIAFPAQWVVVFVDSRAFHGRGRTFTTDRRAWNSVAGLWRPFWVDSTILRDSLDDLVAQIRQALEEAPTDRAPAVPAPCRCRQCRAF